MRFRDLISLTFEDMRQMKLRSVLTISGVVIAIATFTAMLSFGAGNMEYVSDLFDRLGLISTLVVYPPQTEAGDTPDSVVVLNDAAIMRLSELPGVFLVYPYDAFEVTVTGPDTTVLEDAQTLPLNILETKLFSQMDAGRIILPDSLNEVMVTSRFLKNMGIKYPDSALGVPLVISTRLARIDSGLVNIFDDSDGSINNRLDKIRVDSLRRPVYLRRIVMTEVKSAMSRFLDGYMNQRELVQDTFTIVGVVNSSIEGGRLKIQPIIMPPLAAARFNPGGFDGNPMRLITTLQSGMALVPGNDEITAAYPQVTLILDEDFSMQEVKDSVEACGYRVFSFADKFKEIQEFMIYYQLAMSIIGLIALVVASLGIINTMIMAIIERTRQIGILISLGADQSDIRKIFLMQSALIGLIGSIAGIIVGWIGTGIIGAIVKMILKNRGHEYFDFFAFPLWLIAAAIAVGMVIALLAGWYPSARAARIDPIQALRNE